MKKTKTETSAAYACFLRGINVGGHKLVSMDRLRAALEKLKYRNVRTLLASGNVIFEGSKQDAAAVESRVETGLKKEFGFDIAVIARTAEEMKEMVESKPFAGIGEKEDVKLYVFLLKEANKHSARSPWESPEKDLRVVKTTPTEIYAVCFKQPGGRYGADGMEAAGKKIQTQVTTRNWNTIVKIQKAMG